MEKYKEQIEKEAEIEMIEYFGEIETQTRHTAKSFFISGVNSKISERIKIEFAISVLDDILKLQESDNLYSEIENKITELKKLTMDKLKQAKDTIAKKYGYENYNMAIYGSSREKPMSDISKYVNEVAIEYHRLMSEWVSVNERLPEIGQDEDYPYASEMILLSDGESVYYGQFEKCPDEIGVFLNSEGDDLMDDDIMITHWKKLPQPPK